MHASAARRAETLFAQEYDNRCSPHTLAIAKMDVPLSRSFKLTVPGLSCASTALHTSVHARSKRIWHFMSENPLCQSTPKIWPLGPPGVGWTAALPTPGLPNWSPGCSCDVGSILLTPLLLLCLRVCVPEQVLLHCKMARSICIFLACSALLCCAPLTQAATKAAKSKDVTKLQIGVKVRSAQCAISQLHILPGLIWALSGLGAGVNAQQSEG